MISCNLNYLLKALSQNKITWGVKASTHEFGGTQCNPQCSQKLLYPCDQKGSGLCFELSGHGAVDS